MAVPGYFDNIVAASSIRGAKAYIVISLIEHEHQKSAMSRVCQAFLESTQRLAILGNAWGLALGI